MPLDVASTDSVTAIFILFYFVRYVWGLADGFTYGIILGVVWHGITRSFLFGICSAVCYSVSGVELAAASHFISVPSECVLFERWLQQRDVSVGFVLDRLVYSFW